MTPAQFAALTSPAALAASLASLQLPGKVSGPGAQPGNRFCVQVVGV
jgi:hypothetical protein